MEGRITLRPNTFIFFQAKKRGMIDAIDCEHLHLFLHLYPVYSEKGSTTCKISAFQMRNMSAVKEVTAAMQVIMVYEFEIASCLNSYFCSHLLHDLGFCFSFNFSEP